MTRENVLALLSGILFGTGLAISGMIDPARVRAFLDVTGNWDPTLAFVMGGALLPMAVAWQVEKRLRKPLASNYFHLPPTSDIDWRLISGAAIFGIGWGLAGICPGPGIAALAVEPIPALLFVLAMGAGMGLHKLIFKTRSFARA
ncbi:MAG: YeeE/YedE family protein [Hyphomicrobium sp.]|nr:YeeE/YedE family protein [Hyphomicrobium sp.]